MSCREKSSKKCETKRGKDICCPGLVFFIFISLHIKLKNKYNLLYILQIKIGDELNLTRSQNNLVHRENMLLYIVSLTTFVEIKNVFQQNPNIQQSLSKHVMKQRLICIYCLKLTHMLNHRTKLLLKKQIHQDQTSLKL